MNFIFRPVHIATLVFFRIAFGILGFADVMGTWSYKHLYSREFDLDKIHFKYYGFEWVHPLPEPFMSLFFIISMVAAICIAIGKWYRVSCIVFALGFSWFFFMEKNFYLNHAYLFILISMLMIFLPADRAFALDNIRKPERQVVFVPWITTGLLAFMMGVVYFYGGLAKLNPDWLAAQPLKIWLDGKSSMFLIGPLISQEWVAYFMSYGGLLLDLTAAFLLLWKRARLWALGAIIFFHFTNLIIFKIGIFPYLSLALTSLFFPADWPLRFFRYLKSRFQWPGKLEQIWLKKLPDHQAESNTLVWSENKRKAITLAVVIFCTIQLLVPFRHHLYEGNVAWNEEGHRYSWRMMLRQKNGTGNFKLVFPDQKRAERHNPRKRLSYKKYRKLITHPDMILQYAHYLRDSLNDIGRPDVKIYADIKLSLNHHQRQKYIDPEVDLAQINWEMFRHSEWILPYEAWNK